MILYWFCWLVLRVYFFGVLRLRVEGLDHFPRKGSLILCCNHFHWLDPLLLGAVSPRQVFYMTKAEAFASPVAGLILRTVGAFPVRRHSADRKAIRQALGLLHDGRTVAVFPEGTRSRDGRLGHAEPGAALLAAWSGSDILPVAISGSYRPGRLMVRFGPVFRLNLPAGRKPSGQDLEQMAEEQIMGAVRGLLRPAGRDSGSAVMVGPA